MVIAVETRDVGGCTAVSSYSDCTRKLSLSMQTAVYFRKTTAARRWLHQRGLQFRDLEGSEVASRRVSSVQFGVLLQSVSRRLLFCVVQAVVLSRGRVCDKSVVD